MMMQKWLDNGGSVSNLNSDAAKFTLHVISKVFFAKTIKWTEDDAKPSPGHTLTYERAISTVFEYNSTIFLTPRPILSKSFGISTLPYMLSYKRLFPLEDSQNCEGSFRGMGKIHGRDAGQHR